jgi:hypothetical protein
MRRGLMEWDRRELPEEAFQARQACLQAAMAARGQDAILLYTNFIRSAAVSHIAAFSPYWADGVLMVPREGEPLFATTLSKRVGSWVQTVAPIRELVHSPRPGAVLGKRLAEMNIRTLAILERDSFPAGLYDDLAEALPGVEIVDGSDAFTEARHPADRSERALLEHADHIATNALSKVSGSAQHAGEAAGIVERYARSEGAEEAYIAIAPDLDSDRRFLRVSGPRALGRRFAIRATVAYKGSWVRHTQTYARGEEDTHAIRRADDWFKTVLADIDRTHALDEEIEACMARLPGARLADWIAEAPSGTHPLSVVASRASATKHPIPALILTVGLDIAGLPWCGAGLTTR